jgi:hypothetical protein
VKLFVCIFDDPRLLPHFLKHYVQFGITEFHVATAPHLAEDIRRMTTGYKVLQYNDFDVAETVCGGISAVTGMREVAQEADEWIVIVDLDEFVEFGEPVQTIAEDMEAEGANIARGIMYDRFAVDGQPKPFDDDSYLPSLYPVRARFIKNVMGGVDVKGVLLKGHLKSRGAHHVFYDEKRYSKVFEISHYKWSDPSLKRIRQAYEMSRAAGLDWSQQYKKILDHYARHGRFAWETFGGELVGPASGLNSSAQGLNGG